MSIPKISTLKMSTLKMSTPKMSTPKMLLFSRVLPKMSTPKMSTLKMSTHKMSTSKCQLSQNVNSIFPTYMYFSMSKWPALLLVSSIFTIRHLSLMWVCTLRPTVMAQFSSVREPQRPSRRLQRMKGEREGRGEREGKQAVS